MRVRWRLSLVAIGIIIVLAAVALWVRGCGRTAALGDLQYYPGATVVGSTSFVGEAFGLPRSAWEQVELRTEAPYAQVRDFYRAATIAGWASTFESESHKSTGRLFTRFLADGRRKHFYAITVEERQTSRDVSVLLRRGVAR
jgi:hypothetical protein